MIRRTTLPPRQPADGAAAYDALIVRFENDPTPGVGYYVKRAQAARSR